MEDIKFYADRDFTFMSIKYTRSWKSALNLSTWADIEIHSYCRKFRLINDRLCQKEIFIAGCASLIGSLGFYGR